jgi:hypothetical protein
VCRRLAHGGVGQLPGCVGIERWFPSPEWAASCFESSLEERAKNLPKLNELYPDMIEWTGKAVPKLIHAPDSPIVAQRLWPPVK